MYAVLRYAIQTLVVPTGRLNAETRSIMALFSVLDVLGSIKKGSVSSRTLAETLQNHAKRLFEAYRRAFSIL